MRPAVGEAVPVPLLQLPLDLLLQAPLQAGEAVGRGMKIKLPQEGPALRLVGGGRGHAQRGRADGAGGIENAAQLRKACDHTATRPVVVHGAGPLPQIPQVLDVQEAFPLAAVGLAGVVLRRVRPLGGKLPRRLQDSVEIRRVKMGFPAVPVHQLLAGNLHQQLQQIHLTPGLGGEEPGAPLLRPAEQSLPGILRAGERPGLPRHGEELVVRHHLIEAAPDLLGPEHVGIEALPAQLRVPVQVGVEVLQLPVHRKGGGIQAVQGEEVRPHLAGDDVQGHGLLRRPLRLLLLLPVVGMLTGEIVPHQDAAFRVLPVPVQDGVLQPGAEEEPIRHYQGHRIQLAVFIGLQLPHAHAEKAVFPVGGEKALSRRLQQLPAYDAYGEPLELFFQLPACKVQAKDADPVAEIHIPALPAAEQGAGVLQGDAAAEGPCLRVKEGQHKGLVFPAVQHQPPVRQQGHVLGGRSLHIADMVKPPFRGKDGEPAVSQQVDGIPRRLQPEGKEIRRIIPAAQRKPLQLRAGFVQLPEHIVKLPGGLVIGVIQHIERPPVGGAQALDRLAVIGLQQTQVAALHIIGTDAVGLVDALGVDIEPPIRGHQAALPIQIAGFRRLYLGGGQAVHNDLLCLFGDLHLGGPPGADGGRRAAGAKRQAERGQQQNTYHSPDFFLHFCLLSGSPMAYTIRDAKRGQLINRQFSLTLVSGKAVAL